MLITLPLIPYVVIMFEKVKYKTQTNSFRMNKIKPKKNINGINKNTINNDGSCLKKLQNNSMFFKGFYPPEA